MTSKKPNKTSNAGTPVTELNQFFPVVGTGEQWKHDEAKERREELKRARSWSLYDVDLDAYMSIDPIIKDEFADPLDVFTCRYSDRKRLILTDIVVAKTILSDIEILYRHCEHHFEIVAG